MMLFFMAALVIGTAVYVTRCWIADQRPSALDELHSPLTGFRWQDGADE